MVKSSFIAALSALALALPVAPAFAEDEPEGLGFGSCSPTLSVSLANDTTVRAEVGARGIFGTEIETPDPEPSEEASSGPEASADPSPDATVSPSPEPSGEPTVEPSASPTPSPEPSPESSESSSSTDAITSTPRIAHAAKFCVNFRVKITAVDNNTGEQIFSKSETRKFWILSSKWTVDIPAGPGTSVTVTASSGGASVSETIRTPGKPGEPQNLVVTDKEPRSMTVSWTPPTSDGGKFIQDYVVQWDSGATTTVTGTSLKLTGLEPEFTYAITVTARNAIGDSIPALVVATTPAEPTAPSAPRNLTAIPMGATSMGLDWDPPADDGGEPVEGYLVSWNGGGAYVADSSALIPGLNPATKYTFEVKARNAVGLSPAATVAKTTVLNPVPRPDRPTKPVNLQVTDVTQTGMSLTWEPPAKDGGSPVTHYLVEWGSGRAAFTPDTDIFIDGLEPGTEYTVKVTAVNRKGASDAAQVRSYSGMQPIPAPTVPGPAQDVQVTGSSNALFVTFDPVADDGGTPVLYYEVSDENGNSTTTEINNWGHGYAVLAGYGSGELHQVTVTPVNQMGAGPGVTVEAQTSFIPVPMPQAPGVVRNLTVVSTDNDSIALRWREPASDGGSPVIGYEVEWGGRATIFVDNPSVIIDNLTAGTEYPISIRAVNQMGIGEALTQGVYTAMSPVPIPERPSVPRNLIVTGSTGTSIAVDWQAPASDGGTPVTGYRVQVQGGVAEVVTDTAALVQGLQPNRTYILTVSALNQMGESDAVSVTARTAAIPPAPSPAPAPQPFTPDVPGGNSDGSVDLDGNPQTVRQTAPGEWPTKTIIRTGKNKPIEKEPLFLTNADQMAELDITYTSPSIKRATVVLDPKTDTYVLKATLKKGKVSGAVILTVDAPAKTVNGISYEPLQSSERFIIRR